MVTDSQAEDEGVGYDSVAESVVRSGLWSVFGQFASLAAALIATPFTIRLFGTRTVRPPVPPSEHPKLDGAGRLRHDYGVDAVRGRAPRARRRSWRGERHLDRSRDHDGGDIRRIDGRRASRTIRRQVSPAHTRSSRWPGRDRAQADRRRVCRGSGRRDSKHDAHRPAQVARADADLRHWVIGRHHHRATRAGGLRRWRRHLRDRYPGGRDRRRQCLAVGGGQAAAADATTTPLTVRGRHATQVRCRTHGVRCCPDSTEHRRPAAACALPNDYDNRVLRRCIATRNTPDSRANRGLPAALPGLHQASEHRADEPPCALSTDRRCRDCFSCSPPQWCFWRSSPSRS